MLLSPLAESILIRRRGGRKPFDRIDHNKFKSAILEANLNPDFRIHDLRHTFAAWCVKGWFYWLDAPLNLYQLGKLMGHSKANTTQKYAHLCVEDLKQLIKG